MADNIVASYPGYILQSATVSSALYARQTDRQTGIIFSNTRTLMECALDVNSINT